MRRLWRSALTMQASLQVDGTDLAARSGARGTSARVILGGVSRIVYVSGMPGAGKTSLAFPLAAELGYSLVTKDLIKETLYDALYVPGEGDSTGLVGG